MEDKYLSVTALTRYIKYKLDNDKNLQEVYLRGEIILEGITILL